MGTLIKVGIFTWWFMAKDVGIKNSLIKAIGPYPTKQMRLIAQEDLRGFTADGKYLYKCPVSALDGEVDTPCYKIIIPCIYIKQ